MNFVDITFWVLFLLILAIESRILFRCRSGGKDKKTLGFVLFGVFLPLILVSIFRAFEIVNSSVFYLYAGSFLLVSGFALRQWAIAVLGKFFIPVVKVQQGQSVIDAGPYSVLRHPSYTGLLFEVAGVCLILGGFSGFVIVLVFSLPAIMYRIFVEESVLARELKGYKKYMLKTYRLLPWIY